MHASYKLYEQFHVAGTIIYLVVPQGSIAMRLPKWLFDSMARNGFKTIRAEYLSKQAKAN